VGTTEKSLALHSLPPGTSIDLHLVVVGLRGKVLVVGEIYRGGFCEKLQEASPMFDRASASWLSDGSAAGQGQAHQQRWQCLWDNIVKQGQKNCGKMAVER